MTTANYNPFKNPMAEQIWDMKYRLKEQDGTPIDKTVQDTWRRVAWALSEPETDRALWADKFYSVLERFQFIPAGRINAGAGTDRNVTLFNCFVMGTVQDSLSGIMDALKEAAITMQAGGGIGYDFSTLRPVDAPVKGVAATASGPLSFMDVWDAMCKTIMSAGVRRGAMMATMRVDHPDIFKFIDAKRDPSRLRMFNLSVLVTDDFMQAVKDNAQFDLVFEGKVYRTVSARGLWDHITQATYAYAEPGVIFIDRINKANNLSYCETIAATNPCLHPDSLVETINGRVKIKDITEPTMVYTMLSDGSLGIKKATASWVSKKNSETIRIKVRSGKELVCTPSHKIFVDRVGWVEAKDLKIGDKLIHLCRARRGAAYSGVKLSTEDNRAYRMEHRMIAGAVFGELSESDDVHHIDGNTYNNNIDNFEVIDHSKHATLTRYECDNNHMVNDYNETYGKHCFVSPPWSNHGSKDVIPMPEYLRSNMKNQNSACVLSISQGPVSDVYDMTVEDTHNFIADFIVVHNCGEQPLPPYGACLLGSMNIPAFLNDDFSINYKMLGNAIRTAVRMMDNVVDVSRFPLPEQEAEAKAKRRIGLGVTGVADAMALGGVVYGSDEGVEWIHKLMKFVARMAYLASIDLAIEKGAFPLFDADKYLDSGNMIGMDQDIRGMIETCGIRNALLTSIAPTGTISLYAGNVSSGIEPIFALEYERKVLQKDGSKITETVRDYAVDKWKRARPGEPLPNSFVTAQTLLPIDHVRMQAAAQRWVDSSISKTINCPEDISFDDFKNVYLQAWELGCKGCTTYRPNDVTGSVLSVKEETAEDYGACEMRVDPETGQLIRSCE